MRDAGAPSFKRSSRLVPAVTFFKSSAVASAEAAEAEGEAQRQEPAAVQAREQASARLRRHAAPEAAGLPRIWELLGSLRSLEPRMPARPLEREEPAPLPPL